MADQLLMQAQQMFEGQIVCLYVYILNPHPSDSFCSQDFEGQKLAELFTTIILVSFAVGISSTPYVRLNNKRSQILALVLGFAQQNIYITLWVGLGGTLLAFFVVIPPFPIYNENPESWLPAGSGIAGSGIEVDGKKIN
jgi:signal peptidase complex subunit 1